MHRFHVIIEETRTTMTLDRLLSNLLAVKLGVNPFTEGVAAHSAVRAWLQAEVDRDPGAFVLARRKVTNRNSQRLQQAVIRAIAASHLLRRLDDWEIA